jgi:hypothetical protein
LSQSICFLCHNQDFQGNSFTGHGPFKIIDKLSDVTFKLQTCDDRKYEQTVHVNRIKRFVNPDWEREEREEPVGDSDNIVKILYMMRSRNDSKRLDLRSSHVCNLNITSESLSMILNGPCPVKEFPWESWL